MKFQPPAGSSTTALTRTIASLSDRFVVRSTAVTPGASCQRIVTMFSDRRDVSWFAPHRHEL